MCVCVSVNACERVCVCVCACTVRVHVCVCRTMCLCALRGVLKGVIVLFARAATITRITISSTNLWGLAGDQPLRPPPTC